LVDRRVVIGKFADGVTYGLRVGMPNVDALLEDGNSSRLSFNSEWTDMVSVLQVGFAYGSSSGSVATGVEVSVTNPGYPPYVEARRFTSGNTMWDDNIFVSNRSGIGQIWSSITPLTLKMPALASGEIALYVVYKIPVILA
jgi:hypothetical protein